MDAPVPGMAPEMDAAIRAAEAAGKAVLEIYGSDFKSKSKEDGSPLTDADIESNRIIGECLAGTGHPVLSEEDADDKSRLASSTVWVVDPLDGTSDFVDRTGEFTVMVALARGGRPEIGVIAQPTEGILFAAQSGLGAFERRADAWSRMSVSSTADLGECRAIGSRHHMSDSDRSFIESLHMKSFASVGSSLKAARISAGDAEAYITSTDKMKEWDTAASHCIVTEAGGRMTGMSGEELTYNNPDVYHRGGILVTNGLIHDRIVSEYKAR